LHAQSTTMSADNDIWWVSPRWPHGYVSPCSYFQADEVIGERHGCLLAPRLPNLRPFGIDRLERIYRAYSESRLMELYLPFHRQMGSTVQQKILSTMSFSITEPANVKAVLSTKFKGMNMLEVVRPDQPLTCTALKSLPYLHNAPKESKLLIPIPTLLTWLPLIAHSTPPPLLRFPKHPLRN
jgi:hypothetical protein